MIWFFGIRSNNFLKYLNENNLVFNKKRVYPGFQEPNYASGNICSTIGAINYSR